MFRFWFWFCLIETTFEVELVHTSLGNSKMWIVIFRDKLFAPRMVTHIPAKMFPGLFPCVFSKACIYWQSPKIHTNMDALHIHQINDLGVNTSISKETPS